MKLFRRQVLGDALDRLRDLPPAAKQGLLDACRAVVLADGRTTADEDHALFAVADTLDATGWTPEAADRVGGAARDAV